MANLLKKVILLHWNLTCYYKILGPLENKSYRIYNYNMVKYSNVYISFVSKPRFHSFSRIGKYFHPSQTAITQMTMHQILELVISPLTNRMPLTLRLNKPPLDFLSPFLPHVKPSPTVAVARSDRGEEYHFAPSYQCTG